MNASLEEGPKFFRILVHQDIPETKMLIPKKYTMDHFDCLSNTATLELPNGDTWLVELVRDDAGRRVWFGNGWQQFSQHYHLQHGHFLLFQLVGSSHFSVIIFNRSAAEIDYSEFTNGEPYGETAQPRLRVKVEVEATATEDGAAAVATNSVSLPSPPRRPSFTKVISKSYQRSAGINNLNVPASFVETHLMTGSGEMTVKLNVGGESWAVKLVIYKQKKGCWMSKGWWKFAMDNSVKAGDRCIFELRNTGDEFDVQILRC